VIQQLRENDAIAGREGGKLRNGAINSEVGTPGDTGYRWLFDGTAESLDGWSQAPGGHFDLLPNGSLLTQGGMGMLWYEAEEFEDFSLKLEFRDVAEGDDYANSGVFIRFPDRSEERRVGKEGRGQAAQKTGGRR